MRRVLFALLVAFALGTAAATAQPVSSWKDPTGHQIRLVAVGDVRLEVLDWGGLGRPIVLLAGGGMTAHVFDEFAHDVGAVLSALKLDRPVLVGHSMAGDDLTTIGRQHSERISGWSSWTPSPNLATR